jgi:hypothetical protein
MSRDYFDAEVISIDSHRNGISGEPFITAIVRWPSAATESGLADDRFVAVARHPDIPSEVPTDRVAAGRKDRGLMAETVALLSIEGLVAGNVGFAEGNSWRGADYVGPAVADAWHDHQLNMLGYCPFRCHAKPWDSDYENIDGEAPVPEDIEDYTTDSVAYICDEHREHPGLGGCTPSDPCYPLPVG